MEEEEQVEELLPDHIQMPEQIHDNIKLEPADY
jgi:hypothetical protein